MLRALSSFSLYLLLHSMLPPNLRLQTTIFSFSLMVLVVDELGWLVPFGPCRLTVFWQLSLELPEGFFPHVTAGGAGGSPCDCSKDGLGFLTAGHCVASHDLLLLWKGAVATWLSLLPCKYELIIHFLIFKERLEIQILKWNLVILKYWLLKYWPFYFIFLTFKKLHCAGQKALSCVFPSMGNRSQAL